MAQEGGEPFYDFVEYRPTTSPGARLPHAWLDDGSTMQDRIGFDSGFTLLRLGGTQVNVGGLAQASPELDYLHDIGANIRVAIKSSVSDW